MFRVYDVSEILFTILEGCIFFVTFSLLSYRKKLMFKQYTKIIFFVFIYTIYTYWITLFFPSGLHSILIIILTVIIFNYIFNSSFLKSLIKTFFVALGISIIEAIISLIGMIIMNEPMNVLLKNDFYVFICSIFAKFIEISAVFILYKINPNISWFNDSPGRNSKFRQLLVVISSVLILLVGTNIYISNVTKYIFLYNVFTFIIYFVLIIAVIMAFREGSKLEIIQYASELKKENLQQLIEFNEMVAKERHEYKNHLNTIYGLCTLNKPDLNEKIKQYINNYANNSETRNLAVDSGNDFVDAIINVKYNNALIKGVEVIPDFSIPLSVANIDENVAVTIISNIIENAFESIVVAQQEKKYIHIQAYIENDNYNISISNNGPMISEADKKKIFSAGFSTKDNSTKKRGYGLSIVKAQIESCGGNISINSTVEVTEFLISLKIKSEQAVS